MSQRKGITPDEKRTIIFIGLVTFVLLIWILWAGAAEFFAKWAIYDSTNTNASAWGDSFGGFNALFGALGFTAVFATLVLQQKALRDQQLDQHAQRFETTFFELLRIMRELRGQLKYTQSPERLSEPVSSNRLANKSKRTGVDAITSAHIEIRYWITKNGLKNRKVDRKEIEDIYLKCVHRRYESVFSAYFRIIYTILNKIRSDSLLSEEQKAYYGNLLRSQLTSHEIALLALNSTAKISKDLSDLIEYFHLLKYVPEGTTRRILKDVFSDKAFEARD